MSINDLCVELVELIANKLESAEDRSALNAASQACRGFHVLLTPRLYRYDAIHDLRSMQWAIAYENTHHRMDIVRKVIEQVPDALNISHIARAVVFNRWDIVDTLIRVPLLKDKLKESVFCDTYNTNVFIEAAIANREDVVRHLFDLGGPKVLEADEQGKHPLLEALYWGSLDMARLLINLGADVHATTAAGHYLRPSGVLGPISALCLAARQGSVELVEVILKRGAGTAELTRALRFAVHGGHPDAVELLIDCGAELPRGILCAAAKGLNQEQPKANVVEILLKHGASANENCSIFRLCTPLVSFANLRDATTVRMLLMAGANAKDRPAMWEAVTKGSVEIVQLLVEHGADIKVAWKGRSPLWNAVGWGHEAVVDYLIERGAGVHVIDHERRSLLHKAVQTGNPTLVGKIFNLHVGVNAVDDYGRQPLQLAVENKNTTVIDLLVARGADVNSFSSPTSQRWFLRRKPLAFYALAYAFRIAKHLVIRHGAGVSNRYEEGNTLLHLAANREAPLLGRNPARLIKVLVQQGADINARNNHDQTPLHVCVTEDHQYSLALANLLDAGADTSIPGGDSEVPFVTALFGQNYLALREFERRRYNFDMRAQSGLTLLMETSQRGLDGPSDWLLARGVEVNAVFNGRTALDMAPGGPLGQMGLRLLYHRAVSPQLPPGAMEALLSLSGTIARVASPIRGPHDPTMRYNMNFSPDVQRFVAKYPWLQQSTVDS